MVDIEQRFHDLEQRHLSLRKEYDAVCAERNSLRDSAHRHETSLAEVHAQLDQVRNELNEKDAAVRNRDAKWAVAEQDQARLQDQYSRKSDECDRLKDYITDMSGQLTSLQSRLSETQSRLGDLESQQMPKEYEILTLRNQKDASEKKAELLERELEARQAEMANLRSSHATQLGKLQAEAAEHMMSVTRLETMLEAAQHTVAETDQALELKSEELRSLRMSMADEKEVFLAELSAQRKLVAVYKNSLDQANRQVEELQENDRVLKESVARTAEEFKRKFDQQRRDMDQNFEGAKQEALQRVQELEGEVAALKARPAQLTDTTRAVAIPIESEGLSITEMYEKVVAAETALNHERSERMKTDLYMKRVLNELESKAPIIAGQRRDYRRLVDSHDNLTHRLDEAVAANTELRSELDRVSQEYATAKTLIDEQDAEIATLSKQIQHLLQQSLTSSSGRPLAITTVIPGSASRSTDAQAVISEHLVKFDDIEGLQTQNRQLHHVVQRLRVDLQRAYEENEQGSGQIENVQALVKQVQEMRGERQKTEEYVRALVQQRNQFAGMLAQGGTKQLTIEAGQVNAPVVPDLQPRLAEAQEEIEKLTRRCERLTDAERILTETIDTHRKELTDLRSRASRAEIESQFQVDRCNRLNEQAKNLQEEVQRANTARSELQGLLIAQQREATTKDADLSNQRDEIQSLKSQLQHATVDKEVAVSTQQRIQLDNESLRDELRRQNQLLDSVQRIEAGLVAKSHEDRALLEEERDRLTRQLDKTRKELSEQLVLSEQKTRVLEEQIKTLSSKAEESAEKIAALRESLAREQGVSKTAQERSNVLERQLQTTQERLFAIQGASTTSFIAEQDAATKELALERALTELEATKTRLHDAEAHADQFRMISQAAERTVKQMMQEGEQRKLAQSSELEQAHKELAQLKAEVQDKRTVLAEQLQELAAVRDGIRTNNDDLNQQIQDLTVQLNVKATELEESQKRLQVLGKDIDSYQKSARAAHANYERELELHVAAAAALRINEEAKDEYRRSAEQAEAKVAEMATTLLTKEQQWTHERKSLQTTAKDLETSMAALRQQNDMLHAQTQTLGTQVDRLLREKEERAMASGSEVVDLTIGKPSDEDIATLQRSQSELREVVRYLRREQETTQAKLEVAESERNRFMNSMNSAQRLLEEVRAELKQEMERNKTGAVSKEDFAKLEAQLHQMNIVRESNAHLRAENQQLAEKSKTLEDQLRAARHTAAPLEEQNQRLTAEIASLNNEKKLLTDDLESWRTRVTRLFSRYGDIDPEEHKQLQTKVRELETSLAEKQSKVDALNRVESEKQLLQKQLQEKIEALNTFAEEKNTWNESRQQYEAIADNLRGKLRTYKQSMTALQAQLTNAQNQLGARAAAQPQAFAPTPAPTPAPAPVPAPAPAPVAAPEPQPAANAIAVKAAPAKIRPTPVSAKKPAASAKQPETGVITGEKRPFPTSEETTTPAVVATPAETVADEGVKQKEEDLRSRLMQKFKAGNAAQTAPAPAAAPTPAPAVRTASAEADIRNRLMQKFKPTPASAPAEIETEAPDAKRLRTDGEGQDVAVEDTSAAGNSGSELSGRWTKEEHERFLEGLRKYGKEWKQIATHVGTRTVQQTKAHAQIHLRKLFEAGEIGEGEMRVDMSETSVAMELAPEAETGDTEATIATSASSLNPQAAPFAPPAAVEQAKKESSGADKESTFLDLRPPSPSGANVPLTFGPKKTLPVPTVPAPAASATPAPAANIFGQTTGKTLFGKPLFGGVQATPAATASGIPSSSMFGARAGLPTRPFGGLPGASTTAPATASAPAAAADAATPAAPSVFRGQSGLTFGAAAAVTFGRTSFGANVAAATATPVTAAAPAAAPADSEAQEEVQAEVQEATEPSTEKVVVLASSARAVTEEERRQQRAARFGAPVAGATRTKRSLPSTEEQTSGDQAEQQKEDETRASKMSRVEGSPEPEEEAEEGDYVSEGDDENNEEDEGGDEEEEEQEGDDGDETYEENEEDQQNSSDDA